MAGETSLMIIQGTNLVQSPAVKPTLAKKLAGLTGHLVDQAILRKKANRKVSPTNIASIEKPVNQEVASS